MQLPAGNSLQLTLPVNGLVLLEIARDQRSRR
jgi:hypothetical protein